MAENILSFALGLQTSEFLSGLGLASGELLSFAGIGELVAKSMEHLNDAIGEGASLRVAAKVD
jgi:hypothetical protein